MDNTEASTSPPKFVRKAIEIAHGLGASGFTEEENAMIASILPSGRAVWDDCVKRAKESEEKHAENVKTHTANCVYFTCAPWWEESEDPEEAERVRETTDLLMEIIGGKASLSELKTYPRAPANPEQLKECVVLARQFEYGKLTDRARTIFRLWADELGVDLDEELKDG